MRISDLSSDVCSSDLKNIATGRDVSLTETFNVRGKTMWTPSDLTKLTLVGDYSYVSTSVGLSIRPLYGSKPARGYFFTGAKYDINANAESVLVAQGGGIRLKSEHDLTLVHFVRFSSWRNRP